MPFKKTLFAILFCIFCTAYSNAQVGQGFTDVSAGGTVSVSRHTEHKNPGFGVVAEVRHGWEWIQLDTKFEAKQTEKVYIGDGHQVNGEVIVLPQLYDNVIAGAGVSFGRETTSQYYKNFCSILGRIGWYNDGHWLKSEVYYTYKGNDHTDNKQVQHEFTVRNSARLKDTWRLGWRNDFSFGRATSQTGIRASNQKYKFTVFVTKTF